MSIGGGVKMSYPFLRQWLSEPRTRTSSVRGKLREENIQGSFAKREVLIFGNYI